MAVLPSSISRLLKSLVQLGQDAVLPYAWYRASLKSGFLRHATPPGEQSLPENVQFIPLALPSSAEAAALLDPHPRQAMVDEAQEIAEGRVRLFGGEPALLELKPPGPVEHWTEYELGKLPWGAVDVKFIWEPCRFGWAIRLGRAYHITGDRSGSIAQAFWHHTETFLDNNPPNLGPNWASAQEVALRLVAMAFALSVFETSPHTTPERRARLAAAIAQHAERIPPSLAYARAQNNNHLLSEAAGLLTAAAVLPNHPSAPEWKRQGSRWFHAGLQSQITSAGTYLQHSTNYHRLMLQLALWVNQLPGCSLREGCFPYESAARLAAATRWLQAVCDPLNGQALNLGPNDGAYLFPFSQSTFHDYRPTLQAAGKAFLGQALYPSGSWDEMAVWFRIASRPEEADQRLTGRSTLGRRGRVLQAVQVPPHIIQSPASKSWAYLRVSRFTSRPGHADQLHMDLWWRGINIAQDAGTFLYNAPPPWENALAHTAVHNTVTLDGEDQMTWAGRFLWLDWAQALVEAHQYSPEGSLQQITAQHNGYRRHGVIHQRKVSAAADGGWEVIDRLTPQDVNKPSPERSFSARLHWLLPDWEWTLDMRDETTAVLQIQSPYGPVSLQVCAQGVGATLVRAGERLQGMGKAEPTWGWASPTYALKTPALSCSFEMTGQLPLVLTSLWQFPS